MILRLFIGIGLDEMTKDHLYKTVGMIQKNISARYTNKQNYHMTIKFIGDSTSSDLKHHIEVVNQATQGVSPFKMTLDRLGTFPRGRKHILWVGTKPHPQFDLLNARIQNAFEEKSIPVSLPHITLARDAVIQDTHFLEIPIDFSFHVRHLCIFESKRIDQKLVYVPKYQTELVS